MCGASLGDHKHKHRQTSCKKQGLPLVAAACLNFFKISQREPLAITWNGENDSCDHGLLQNTAESPKFWNSAVLWLSGFDPFSPARSCARIPVTSQPHPVPAWDAHTAAEESSRQICTSNPANYSNMIQHREKSILEQRPQRVKCRVEIDQACGEAMNSLI